MGGDMFICIFFCVRMGKFLLVLLRFGSWGYNGRNEWRKLIFISRIYKWNFLLCFIFIFIFIFRSFFFLWSSLT